MASVTIKNIDRLTHKLNNIANMDVMDTMKKATMLVHSQAVELAVFEKGYSKGQLRESIHFDVKKLKDEIQGRVYTNTSYALYVEFGTGVRGDGSYPYKIDGLDLKYDDEWAGMEAQPFMYPALNTHRKTIKKMFKTGVKDELRANCKGGK